MAPENAICNKARECLAAFNHCIESMTSTPWPQDQLDRFNLWAAHGGIFGSYQGRTSMDWRLRERPELVDMMLQLLDLLHEYLSAIYTLADPVSDPVSDLKFHAGRTITATQDAGHQTQPPSSHTSASTSSSECSFGLGSEKLSVVADPVDTMRGKVEQTIAELFRISAAIRSAGMSYRYTKAANFVEWQDGVNLTLRFKEGVELLLRYKKPSPSDYMVKRLVETVCLRQRELAYSRRKGMGRSGKEATEESIKSDGVASLPQRSTAGYPGQCGSGSTMSKITPTAIGASREKTAQPNTVQSTIYTATYVPTTVFPQAKPVKTLITRPQWRTIDDSLTNLPLSPEVGATLEFECPYCAIPFERTKFQGSSWRNHVLEDLRPYICILPDCITPHALYQDSISWISHMQTKHKVVKWKCVSSCHPEIQAFSTEAEFLAHTEFEHKEDFTTEEMLELANLGRYEITRELEVDILPKCPICMISFESEDFLSVYSHIAEDLVDYARISLPESPHADANSSQEDSSKSASVDDGRIGQRRESEIEANRMFPWSLWDFDSPETRGDLDCYDDGLNRIPDPSNTDVAVLAEIRYDICNARHKRLQKKPDHNLHLLRQYREEPNPHKDEDMTFFFKDPALHTKTASNLPDHQSQSSVEDSQSEKTDEGVTTIPMLQSFNDHTHLRKNHTGIVYENYTVGWICAIITEYVAARQFLDEEHEGPVHVSLNDNNDYTLGKIGKHNVVITVLPPVDHGASPAASVAREMLHSFPNMRFCLIVGIGSGAPSKGHDIRLGDIVVGTPRYGEGGVLPYDFGRTIQHRSLQHIGVLNQPPTVLLEAVNELQAKYEINGHRFGENIDNILRKMPRLQKKYSRPDPSSDRLYQSKIMHSANSDSSCVASCGTDPSKLIQRTERTQDKDNPVIHYGVIASGDQLMEDASVRDKLAAEEDILCFEMGAAGLINQFPCLVVCGICDYSDSHKNMEWQGYAAMAAAAYAKDLLCQITLAKVEDEKTFGDILSGNSRRCNYIQ
ncbi:hypothetical protein QQS21_008671 [Conoideocrella luteorostrata]|uniref:Nucleoside phosphorylase domain-containing protein n=1 Tax=Conoideocrella luteorostrata TaxID=1105319 RepID=A0AAJ0FWC2_9HYPO|nr:hypothetical protein QQS21_008671 [Conoideocrella luteorostrata]